MQHLLQHKPVADHDDLQPVNNMSSCVWEGNDANQPLRCMHAHVHSLPEEWSCRCSNRRRLPTLHAILSCMAKTGSADL